MNGLQPDIAGYMATLTSTEKPLEMCPSCQRALTYGALMYAGGVLADLQDADKALHGFRIGTAIDRVVTAQKRATFLIEILMQFVKVDLMASLPGADDLGEEDWKAAIGSFMTARCEHYFDPETGQIKFEPHDGDPSGDEALV